MPDTTPVITPTDTGVSYLCWTGTDDSIREFKMLRMNGSTGSVTVLGGSGFFTQLVYGPDGSLYAVASTLCKVDPQTAATTLIGNLTLSGSTSSILMAGAEFSPSGILYVVENGGSGRIFTVNIATGMLTLVGIPSVTTRDVAIDKQGTMYAGSATLVILNPADVTTKNTVGSGIYIGGSMFFSAAGTLLKNDIFPSTYVYTISLSTGQATALLRTGSSGIVAVVEEKKALVKAREAIEPRDGGRPWTPDREYLLKLERAYKDGISEIDF
jgi:hypothetical protein